MFESNTQFCTHSKHETPCQLPCRACEEECDTEIIPCLEININGNISTLYNDDIDLYDLGLVTHVRRASFIEFNEIKQEWEIIHVQTKKIIGHDKNREKAIKKEIEMFQPSGKYYEE